MSADQQLRWEAENGPRFAVAAFVSVPLILASIVVPAVVLGGTDGRAEELVARSDHQAGPFIGVGLQALAYIALAAVFYYLARVIIARSVTGLRILWPLIFLGPVLAIVASLVIQINLDHVANDFVASGARSDERAKELIKDNSSVLIPLGLAGSLSLAVTFVLLGVNGMRTGILSRFMGILGILAAAVPALIPGAGAIVQLFWVSALGMLFLNRWPNGRGPAWEVVEAVPWPTAADAQAARQAAEQPEGETPSEPEPGDDEDGQPRRQRSSRSKKKRRGGH